MWSFTEKTGKWVRSAERGGVDWWRYLNEILYPKLFPFAEALLCYIPNVAVQEDKAPSHASKIQAIHYSVADILRLFWPVNSPDLNMIEPCWAYMKRETTKKGPLTSRTMAERAWMKVYNYFLFF